MQKKKMDAKAIAKRHRLRRKRIIENNSEAPQEHKKSKFSTGTSITPDLEGLKRQTLGCAKFALAYYNEKNLGAEFELVEAISSNAFTVKPRHRRSRQFYHVNFRAKPKNESDDTSPKLFFAEMNLSRRKARCFIIDPNSPGTKTGCDCCDEDSIIYHPPNGFLHGLVRECDPVYPKFKRTLITPGLEGLKRQTRGCANAALAYYNKQNPAVEFELVEAISSNAFTTKCKRRFYHVNFRAKPKNECDDTSPKLFFAEMNLSWPMGRCLIIDPNSPGTKIGCDCCDEISIIYHPPNGFVHGRVRECDPVYPKFKRRSITPDLEGLKQQTLGCANAGLAYYNKQNPGAEFELVTAISSNAFTVKQRPRRKRQFYHVNFRAKPKNECDDTSPKLFFAEVNFPGPTGRCFIIDPNCPGTKTGCHCCDEDSIIYHPPNGFVHGPVRECDRLYPEFERWEFLELPVD